MSKKYLWRLQTIIMAGILSIGFSSCCCDKEDEVTPSTSGDGLEGYWLEDLYKSELEEVDEGTPESSVVEKQTYDDSNPGFLIYLDGKGGGTCYYRVCTEEKWMNSDEEFKEKYTYKIGAFKDFMDNTHTYYGYKQEALLYFRRGSTIILAVGNANSTTNASTPNGNSSVSLADLLANPDLTIGEILGNSNAPLDGLLEAETPPSLLNFIDGNLYGYHRATKVQ